MSIFNLACAALGGTASSPNVIDVPDGVSSIGYAGEYAGVSFKNNGSYALYYSGVPIVEGTWTTPQTNISQYEIYATLDSGDTPDSGTQASWLALSTTRTWLLLGNPSAKACQLTFNIRWTGDNSEQDTGTVTLTASDSPAPPP